LGFFEEVGDVEGQAGLGEVEGDVSEEVDQVVHDGRVVGVTDVLRLLEEIPNKVQSLLGIVVDVNLKTESGLEYIQIVVEAHPQPITYRGEFHYRSGSTKQVLQGAALSRMMLRKFGRTWDDTAMPGVRVGSLDDRAFEEFKRRGIESKRLPPEILEESDYSVIEQLQLREAEFLKRAAVLLFHPAPDDYFPGGFIKIGYFEDGEEVAFQDEARGHLFAQVDRTMDLLYTKYTRALISYEGIYRIETSPVPREAMREAVVNAVVHRDYAVSSPIQIQVLTDRIEIWNPADLPPEWKATGRDGRPVSQSHNPRVANASFRAAMIEAWGRGIRRIVRASVAAGNPTPIWTLDEGGAGLSVTFPLSDAYRDADPMGGKRTTGRPPENRRKPGGPPEPVGEPAHRFRR